MEDTTKTLRDNIINATFKMRLNKVMDVSKFTSSKFISFAKNLKIMCTVLDELGYNTDFLIAQDKLVCSVFNRDSSKENPYGLFYDYKDDRVGIVDEGMGEIGEASYDNVDLLFNVYTSEYIKILP